MNYIFYYIQMIVIYMMWIKQISTTLTIGTTLNLLKFPMLNPVPWKLHRRIQRLLRERSSSVEEERLRRKNLKATGRLHYATLMGTGPAYLLFLS